MYRALSAARRTSTHPTFLEASFGRFTSPAGVTRGHIQTVSVARCYSSTTLPFAERDLVVLRPVKDASASPILSRPLAVHNLIQTHKGTLYHRDIIGKLPRDLVTTTKGVEYRIHPVSLAEYALLSKRLVTPIYPPDANLIVSLFDLHLSPSSLDSSSDNASHPPVEILEAGTGHGALTLHLSRAIHAANPPKPALPATSSAPLVSDEPVRDPSDGSATDSLSTDSSPSISSTPDSSTTDSLSTDSSPSISSTPNSSTADSLSTESLATDDSPIDTSATTTHENPMTQWKATRRAILHTIDVSPRFSQHARKVVRGFRHGLYADNVDFHVGDVSEWVQEQVTKRSQASASASASTSPADLAFLTHAILDLPATQNHIGSVASALHTDGILMIFNPSITQILECVEKVKRESLPLWLDQVIELGQNGTSGGREWDVRTVRPRADVRKDEEQAAIESVAQDTPRDVGQAGKETRSQNWSTICRPKVGDRISGGGFIGIFRKMKDRVEGS